MSGKRKDGDTLSRSQPCVCPSSVKSSSSVCFSSGLSSKASISVEASRSKIVIPRPKQCPQCQGVVKKQKMNLGECLVLVLMCRDKNCSWPLDSSSQVTLEALFSINGYGISELGVVSAEMSNDGVKLWDKNGGIMIAPKTELDGAYGECTVKIEVDNDFLASLIQENLEDVDSPEKNKDLSDTEENEMKRDEIKIEIDKEFLAALEENLEDVGCDDEIEGHLSDILENESMKEFDFKIEVDEHILDSIKQENVDVFVNSNKIEDDFMATYGPRTELINSKENMLELDIIEPCDKLTPMSSDNKSRRYKKVMCCHLDKKKSRSSNVGAKVKPIYYLHKMSPRLMHRSCYFCNKEFTSTVSLRQHLESSHNLTVVRCKFCKNIQKFKGLLQQCGVCFENFQKSCFWNHLKSSHTTVTCHTCQKKFSGKASLGSHINRDHQKDMKTCFQCYRKLPETCLRSHEVWHNGSHYTGRCTCTNCRNGMCHLTHLVTCERPELEIGVIW